MSNNRLGRNAPPLAEWIDLRETLADAETVSSAGLPATLSLRDLMQGDWAERETQRLWKEAVNKPAYRWLAGLPHYKKALHLFQENFGRDWRLDLRFAARLVFAINGYLSNVHRKAPARNLPADERRKLLKKVEGLSTFLEKKDVNASTTLKDALKAFAAEQRLLLGKGVRVDKTWREREFIASLCSGLITAFGWDNRKAISELAGLVDYRVPETIDAIRSNFRRVLRRQETVRQLAQALLPDKR